MNLVCFGAGEKSRRVRKILEEKGVALIVAFVEDENFSKINSNLDGLDVVSVYTMKDMYKNNKIDGVVIPSVYHKHTVKKIIASCKNFGILDANIYLMNHNVYYGEDRKHVLIPYKEFVQIYELAFHVTDSCNMKCELCFHFAQFAPPPGNRCQRRIHRKRSKTSSRICA